MRRAAAGLDGSGCSSKESCGKRWLWGRVPVAAGCRRKEAAVGKDACSIWVQEEGDGCGEGCGWRLWRKGAGGGWVQEEIGSCGGRMQVVAGCRRKEEVVATREGKEEAAAAREGKDEAPRSHHLGFHGVDTVEELITGIARLKNFNLDSSPILSIALPSKTGRVLSIQSHTVQGYVGNKSAVFPLQLLGYDVDPINSVQFSNHTGYPTFKGQVLDGQQLWDLIEGLAANNLLYYTHLLTGYIGSVSFLNSVMGVVEKLRLINPELIYVCDPVMGDDGKFYVAEELVSLYREKVVPVASMLTPNQFEAELLTGSRITSENDGLEACNKFHAAGPNKVIITSLKFGDKLLLIGSHQKVKGGPSEQFKIVMPRIPAYFTGTGDLMTALLLGWSNKYPDDLCKASELAVSSLQAVLQRTTADYEKAGFDIRSDCLEIRLIQSQEDIRKPVVKYTAEKYS